MRRKSTLKRILQLTFGLVKNEHVPKFSSKFSKKIFTQHQLLVLGVLKIYWNKDYRQFADFLLFANSSFQFLKLKRIPHFTTLQKFLQRFDQTIFDQLIAAVFSQIAAVNRPIDVAVDGSGFTSSYCSRYFVMRINRETSYRTFMKMSIAVDPRSRALLAVKCRKGPSHDTKDFIPLLRRADKCIDQRIRNVIADRAYDSCKNFHFVEKELHADAVIPVRVYRSSRSGNGTIRKHRPILPDSRIYGRRNLAETTFSVIKRKFSGDLRSRLTEVKKKEMKLKALTYNLMILTTKKSLFIVGGFLQSPISIRYLYKKNLIRSVIMGETHKIKKRQRQAKDQSNPRIPELLTKDQKLFCDQSPPFSPDTAMYGTMLMSGYCSRLQNKKKRAEIFSAYIWKMVHAHEDNEYVSRYLTDVYSLMLNTSTQMRAVGNNNNKKLDEEDTLWTGKKKSLSELKKSEMQKLEDSYAMKMQCLNNRRTGELARLQEVSSPVTLKGSVAHLIGAAGVVSLLHEAQKEIMKLIHTLAPDAENVVFLSSFVAIAGAVFLTSKAISSYFMRKMEDAKKRFDSEEDNIKQDRNEEVKALITVQEERDETEFKKYTARKQEIGQQDIEVKKKYAVFVYLETFKICENFFPDYIKKYKRYLELTAKDPDAALAYIRDRAAELAGAKLLTDHTMGQ